MTIDERLVAIAQHVEVMAGTKRVTEWTSPVGLAAAVDISIKTCSGAAQSRLTALSRLRVTTVTRARRRLTLRRAVVGQLIRPRFAEHTSGRDVRCISAPRSCRGASRRHTTCTGNTRAR